MTLSLSPSRFTHFDAYVFHIKYILHSVYVCIHFRCCWFFFRLPIIPSFCAPKLREIRLYTCMNSKKKKIKYYIGRRTYFVSFFTLHLGCSPNGKFCFSIKCVRVRERVCFERARTFDSNSLLDIHLLNNNNLCPIF